MGLDLVDIGANLSHDSFRNDIDAVIARATEAGVSQLVVTGASEVESTRASEIASKYSGRLFSTAGVHPHLAREWTDDTANALRALANAPHVVAVGETGLDFNRDFSPRNEQVRAFEAQLALAIELKMPIFLHERDAHRRFAEIIASARDDLVAAVIHCFTGPREELHAYIDLDLHVGITGWICDERRGMHLRELVKDIPANRLMIETDSPYLLPRDLRPKPKSRRNEPLYLPHILEEIAVCRGEAPEELAQTTTGTARQFFRLPAPPLKCPKCFFTQ